MDQEEKRKEDGKEEDGGGREDDGSGGSGGRSGPSDGRLPLEFYQEERLRLMEQILQFRIRGYRVLVRLVNFVANHPAHPLAPQAWQTVDNLMQAMVNRNPTPGNSHQEAHEDDVSGGSSGQQGHMDGNLPLQFWRAEYGRVLIQIMEYTIRAYDLIIRLWDFVNGNPDSPLVPQVQELQQSIRQTIAEANQACPRSRDNSNQDGHEE